MVKFWRRPRAIRWASNAANAAWMLGCGTESSRRFISSKFMIVSSFAVAQIHKSHLPDFACAFAGSYAAQPPGFFVGPKAFYYYTARQPENRWRRRRPSPMPLRPESSRSIGEGSGIGVPEAELTVAV